MKERQRKIAVVCCGALLFVIVLFTQSIRAGIVGGAVVVAGGLVYLLSRLLDRERAFVENTADENYEKRIKAQVSKYEAWKTAAIAGRRVTDDNLSVLKNEEVYLRVDGVGLFELRMVGSRSVGMSLSILDGFAVHRFDTEYLRDVDEVDVGSVYLTNMRLIFVGAATSRIVELPSVVKIESSECFVSLMAQGRDENMILKNVEGVFFGLALRDLQRGRFDPA